LVDLAVLFSFYSLMLRFWDLDGFRSLIFFVSWLICYFVIFMPHVYVGVNVACWGEREQQGLYVNFSAWLHEPLFSIHSFKESKLIEIQQIFLLVGNLTSVSLLGIGCGSIGR